jgi:hypothetical protein
MVCSLERIFELLSCSVRGRNEIRPLAVSLELMITGRCRWFHMSFPLIKEMVASGLEFRYPLSMWSTNTTTPRYCKQRTTKGVGSRAAHHFLSLKNSYYIISVVFVCLGALKTEWIAETRGSILQMPSRPSHLNVIIKRLGTGDAIQTLARRSENIRNALIGQLAGIVRGGSAQQNPLTR